MVQPNEIEVRVSNGLDCIFVWDIIKAIKESSKDGSVIVDRTYDYLSEKIANGDAVIATYNRNLAGFSYIEAWEQGKFVSSPSCLFVLPQYRGTGVASEINRLSFTLAQKKYPNADIFTLTINPKVMSMNTHLGYVPVDFSSITSDIRFWDECKSCHCCDMLNRTGFKYCGCTAMMYKNNKTKEYENRA